MVAKRIEIDRELRTRIIDEIYPPGSRLPTRIALEREYGVSSNTIQRALNRLIKDGFVVAKGREGTFAVDNPPHLSRIAVLFPGSYQYCIERSQFFRAFSNEIKPVSRKMNVSFEIVDAFNNWRSMEKIQKLVDDVQEKRLAGLIFAAVPSTLEKTPILEEPNIARVGVMSRSNFGIPAVWHDNHGLFRKALDYFEQEGCRTPAFLIPDGIFDDSVKFITENGKGRDLMIHPRFLQQFSLGYRQGINNLIELLFDLERHDVPDCLLVNDDNILGLVTYKLRQMGFNGKDDVRILSMANFPWPTESYLPVLRIGFEANKILEICVETIKKQLDGDGPDMLTTLPALYEHEI